MAKNLTVSETNDRPMEIFGLQPRSLSELYEVCERIASTDMVPKDMRGKPNNVLVAVQMGLEIGLAPMQALQNIAVINGRPSMFGDAIPAVAQATGQLEDWQEWFNDETQTAHCRIKRRGLSEHEKTFSFEDAKAAGLLGKDGPWKLYPKRMCQMRARAFAFRDRFADALKGVHVAEEVRDYVEMGDADVVGRNQPEPPKRKSETQQESADASGATSSEKPAKASKGKGRKQKDAQAAPATGEAGRGDANDSGADPDEDGPPADKLIEKIALCEDREALTLIVGNTTHLSEADKKRVTECGRSRWRELGEEAKAESEGQQQPAPAQGEQQGFELPADYGEEK